MAWGTLTIGSLVLKETDILEDVTNANTGVRSVRLGASETFPGDTLESLKAKQEDIMALMDRLVPITFERKPQYNGFYRATDTNTELEKWVQGPMQVRWALSMDYLGPDSVLDFESKLSNVVRANDFSLTGERWHAPPVGHYGYYTGATSPTTLTRTTADGAMTVYRAIPAGVSPRWSVATASYQLGRVRFLYNGIERINPNITTPATGWELSNALVRVRPAAAAGTTLLVAFYDGTTWREKAWDIRIGPATSDTLLPATHFGAVTVLRADPEATTVRLVAKQPTNGSRTLVDLTLRRGSRLLEGYVQRTASGDIGVVLDAAEATQVGTGYVYATAADTDGNKFTVGSARTFSGVPGGLTVTGRVALDFYISVEKTGAAAGDTLVTLRDQYIGTMAEKVGVVRR